MRKKIQSGYWFKHQVIEFKIIKPMSQLIMIEFSHILPQLEPMTQTNLINSVQIHWVYPIHLHS